jgi:hypothetical protein
MEIWNKHRLTEMMRKMDEIGRKQAMKCGLRPRLRH